MSHRQMPRRALSWLRTVFVLPIRGYRRWISPLRPPSCIYTPTCSAFAEHAIQRYGLVLGTLLGLLRILRCHGLFRGGEDPVPEHLGLREIFGPWRERWLGLWGKP